MLPYCINCSVPVLYDSKDDLCGEPVWPKCYRDPKTNSCQDCSSHVEGIDYVYTCYGCAKPVPPPLGAP
jgi:hypothetical protein